MSRTQRYGIKFPTSIDRGLGLLDLNDNQTDSVKSQLIHLIFTPEGQRLRDPQFGTSLIKFLHDDNTQVMWDDISMEIKEKVTKYIPNCVVNEITANGTDDDHGVEITVRYSVTERDGSTHSYELTQTLN